MFAVWSREGEWGFVWSREGVFVCVCCRSDRERECLFVCCLLQNREEEGVFVVVSIERENVCLSLLFGAD